MACGPSDMICRRELLSSLVQLIACYLKAQSHYLAHTCMYCVERNTETDFFLCSVLLLNFSKLRTLMPPKSWRYILSYCSGSMISHVHWHVLQLLTGNRNGVYGYLVKILQIAFMERQIAISTSLEISTIVDYYYQTVWSLQTDVKPLVKDLLQSFSFLDKFRVAKIANLKTTSS